MNDDRSKEPEDIPSREERENIDDLPAASEGHNGGSSSDSSPHRERDSSEVLGDDGQQSPDIDETILAELVDEDDTPEERDRKLSLVRSISSRYQGPIPPAEQFAKYAEVDPKAPGAILDMAQTSNKAAANRLDADAEMVRANAESVKANARIDEKAVPRGQYISGGLIFVLLIISGVAVFLDRAWYVALFGAGGLGLMFMNTLPSIHNRDSRSKQESAEIEIRDD